MQLVASLKALQRPKRQITRVEFYWIGCNIVVRYWREWAQYVQKLQAWTQLFHVWFHFVFYLWPLVQVASVIVLLARMRNAQHQELFFFVQTTWLPRKVLYPWPISISSEVSFFFPRKRALAGVALFLYIQWNLVNLKPVEPRKIFVLSGSTNYQKSNKNSKNHVRYFS